MSKVRVERIRGLMGQFAPILKSVSILSSLPNETHLIEFHGFYFTPNTQVVIDEHIVNGVEFVSPEQLNVSVSFSAVEGSVNIFMSNGVEITYYNILLVSLGTVYPVVNQSFINKTGVLTTDNLGTVKTKGFEDVGTAESDRVFDMNINHSIIFTMSASDFIAPGARPWNNNKLEFLKQSDSSLLFDFRINNESPYYQKLGNIGIYPNLSNYTTRFKTVAQSDLDNIPKTLIRADFVDGELIIYNDGVEKSRDVLTEITTYKLKASVGGYNFNSIKYVVHD